LGKTINPIWEQDSAQGFDDGTESGSSSKAAVNTGWTQGLDEIFLYRMLIQETAGATESPTFQVRLQYRRNGGSWVTVTTGTTNVQIADSSNLTHGGDTTQRIGVDADYVVNNNWVADTSGDTNTTTDTFGTGVEADISECEALWALKLTVGDDWVDGDTVEFQAIQTDDAVLDSYVPASIFTIDVDVPAAGGWPDALKPPRFRSPGKLRRDPMVMEPYQRRVNVALDKTLPWRVEHWFRRRLNINLRR
jgi:hypothetical protein